MAFKINSKTIKKGKKYIPNDKGELVKFIVKICKESKDDIVDLNNIDLSNLTNISYLFIHNDIKVALKKRNIDVSEWNVSQIKDFHNMFEGFTSFDCDLSEWNMENAIDCKSMFNTCTNFKGHGLETWNMKKVRDIGHMFHNCENLECDLSNWSLDSIKEHSQRKYVFGGSCKLESSKRPKINGRVIRD